MGAFHTQLLDLIEYNSYMAWFADPSRELAEVEPFTYVIDANATAITNAQPGVNFDTQMMDDSDFVLTTMSQFARVAGASQLLVNPAILVQIVDTSTARGFFAAPSPLPMVAGQGGFNFILPGPKVIKSRASLRTTAISAQAVTFDGFFMGFHGARLWYR